MSNVSIYDKNWIDLVFEGKNKEYGAYKLRQENSKTSLMAFLSGIGSIAGIAGIGMLISSFNSTAVSDKPTDAIDPEGIHVTEVVLREKEVIKKPNTATETPAAAAAQPNLFTNFIPVETPLTNNVPITRDIVPETGSTSNNGNENGNTSGTEAGIATGTGSSTGGGSGNSENNTVNTTNLLDVMPEYPGGIEAFHKYIGRNIESPEMDGDATTVTAIVSFVIEKDGSLSDIKVLRSTNKDLERAAIKVLKSLKIKWKPGMKNGEYVRTLYVQPIRVNTKG